MANLFKMPNDSGGFDRGRNTLVLPLNTTDSIYLVAGSSLKVNSSDPLIVTASAESSDSPGSHKMPGLSDWESAQNIRKITLTSSSSVGSALVWARDGNSKDQIAPLKVI